MTDRRKKNDNIVVFPDMNVISFRRRISHPAVPGKHQNLPNAAVCFTARGAVCSEIARSCSWTKLKQVEPSTRLEMTKGSFYLSFLVFAVRPKGSFLAFSCPLCVLAKIRTGNTGRDSGLALLNQLWWLAWVAWSRLRGTSPVWANKQLPN